MNRYVIPMLAVALMSWSQAVSAQDLVIGSKAPKLQVSKFVKGEPIKGFDKEKIYVVEFWATWCGPCIKTIPHLTKLQKQYKDITFVGVAILEQDQDAVEEFVEKMGDKMDYRVALDLVDGDKPGEGAMVKNWMEPADQQGIPAAFIINGDGVVAWIGHPGEIDEPLEKISSGKWDILAEIKKAKEIAAERQKSATILTKLNKMFGEFKDGDDPTELLTELDAAAKQLPTRAPQFMLVKLQLLSGPKGDVEQALELGQQLLESDLKDDADALNNIAWMLVTPEREKKLDPRLMKFALKVAIKADELEEGEDYSIADTLAKAYFDNGQLDKAVETQQRAVEIQEDLVKEEKAAKDPGIEKRLRQYKRALEASKANPPAKK